MFGPLHPDLIGLDEEEYRLSIQFFSQLERFRKAFFHIRVKPPLKRGDLLLLGSVDMREREKGKKATVSWLAHRMNITPAGISQKVNFLVDAGYLRRVGDTADRRVTFLETTKKGREVTRLSMLAMLSDTESALRQMGTEKIEQLTALMGEFADLLPPVPEEPFNTQPKGGM